MTFVAQVLVIPWLVFVNKKFPAKLEIRQIPT
jgi:hypothetical protein